MACKLPAFTEYIKLERAVVLASKLKFTLTKRSLIHGCRHEDVKHCLITKRSFVSAKIRNYDDDDVFKGFQRFFFVEMMNLWRSSLLKNSPRKGNA